MLPLLLVVGSQGEGASQLRSALNVAGFKAYYVESLQAAFGIAQQWQFDAALVDPKGLEVGVVDLVKGLRTQVGHIPVLAILHSDGEDLLLKVLGAGASQAMAQAPSPRVIAAQLHRWIDVFRSRQKDESGPVQLGPLRLDPRRASATIKGIDLKLTGTEFELLLLLTASAGKLVHRTMITRTLSAFSVADKSRTADMHVSRIRRKLNASSGGAVELLTVYGQGYLLRLTPETESGFPQLEWSV